MGEHRRFPIFLLSLAEKNVCQRLAAAWSEIKKIGKRRCSPHSKVLPVCVLETTSTPQAARETSMKPGLSCTLLSAAWLVVLLPVRAGDWPMLGRDSSRNAVSPEKDPPLRWQIEERNDEGGVTKAGLNILWKARLGNNNFAPPIVSGGLVWIGTNNGRPRDANVKVQAGVLMCFRARDGKFLWQH